MAVYPSRKIVIPDIPVGISWIASSGTQFIDTGMKMQSGTTVTLHIKTGTSVSGSTCIFGSIYNNGTRYNVGISNGYFEFQYGSGYGASSTPVTPNTEYTIVLEFGSGTASCTVNGSAIQTRSGKVSAANHNAFLMARNNGGNADRKASISVFSCEITRSGNRINLLPYLDGTTACMKDSVSGTVYRNAGTGSFTYG